MIVALVLYGMGVLIWGAYVAMKTYPGLPPDPDELRRTARLFMMAPVWPLAALYFAMKAVPVFRDLVKDARS